MKIKIRYENEYQTLEVENMELEKWLNISISEEESQEDYEKRVQDVIEERFNRPDYNSWHKHDRHTGNAYMKSKDGTVEVNTEEAIMFRAADKSPFNISIDGVHNQLEYEECCETLRSLLKPAQADMVIAIALDGYTVGEYAAEIGLEHHLGMTCDPVYGYVQVPCIERNAVAAKRAYDAAKYAMLTDGYHTITLDQVMQTMKETGHDLMAKYRETAQGGLAKHFAEC